MLENFKMEYSQMDQPSNATLFFFFVFFLWIKARPPVDTTSLDLSELMDRVDCICTMLAIANPCKCKALLW